MRTHAAVALLALTVLAARPARAPERVAANDNRVPAGTLRAGVLTLRLEARRAEWRPHGDGGPGAPMLAFAEEGRAPQIPGPLVRVPAGTEVAVTVRNALGDAPLAVHGLHDRLADPAAGGEAPEPLRLAPGEARAVRLRLDAPGTYYYWGTTTGRRVDFRTREDAQLTGAIVVDPPGEDPRRDRVLVIGMWTDTVARVGLPRERILAVLNGRAWPHTERLHHAVGDTVRWRVINASADLHPMHLHGFYFRVDARGDARRDTAYALARGDSVNTEAMPAGSTVRMTWVPQREGNWLFHCHIPEHFAARGPFGMPRPRDAGHAHAVRNHALEGMGGLVTGIHVRPARRAALVARPAPADERARRRLRLLVRPNAGGTDAFPFYGFALHEGGAEPAPDSGLRLGPPIVLTRGEPVSITVVNRLPEPTAVHWHGIELESYFDGVAGFGGVGRRISPAVAARDSFEARFTPPRAGTFIYHTHVDEERQQPAGLAGPLLVVEPGQRLDPATDLVVLITSPNDSASDNGGLLVNGRRTPAPLELRAGVPHRLRIINMALRRAGPRVEMRRDGAAVTWRPLAKDGHDLPAERQTERPARQIVSIGETYDMEVTPAAPGDLELGVFFGRSDVRLATLPVRVR